MKLKRSLVIVLTSCLLLTTSLTACKSQKETQETQNTQETQEVQATQDTQDAGADSAVSENAGFDAYEDTLTISLGRYAPASAASKFKNGDTFVNNCYTRYIKNRLNIDFVDEFEAEGDTYTNQVALALASGELPDIISVTSYDTLVQLVDNDLIYDLTDLYDQYASDYIKSLYDSYDGRCLSMATFDGKLMALPGTNADNNVPVLCWVRKDWLDKLGMNPDPDGNLCITIDDIKEMAKAFVKADFAGDGSTVGIALNGAAVDDNQALANAMGGYVDKWVKDDSGKVSWSTLTDSNKATWSMLHDWYKEGILDPQFGTRTWDDISSMLINNQLGIAFGAWHIPDWRLASVKSLVPEAEFVAYTIADSNGKVNTFHENASDRYIVVSKSCKHPEAALKIMNVLYDELARANKEQAPEVLDYISSGGENSARPFYIECLTAKTPEIYYNEHKAVIDGTMKPEETTIAENVSSSKAVLDYLAADTVTEDTIGGWHYYESRIIGLGASVNALNQNGNASWITPLYPPTTSTMQQKKATLDKLELESYIKIVTGEEPIDYFDQFVSDWKSLGGDEIVQELDAIYSE